MKTSNLIDAIKLLLDASPTEQKLECYAWLRDELDKEVGQPLGMNVREIELRGGAQSKAFMASLLPKIWTHMQGYPRGTSFSVLDVGPGSGFGTELLASIHAGPFIGYRASVSVLDIRDIYFDLMKYRLPLINKRIKKDLYHLEERFDLAICSHVIEHVPDPVGFVRQLQNVSRQKVFLLAPWKEDPNHLTKGHINILDESFIEAFSDAEWSLEENIAWGAFLTPRYKMLYMGLPGRAS